MTDKEEFMIKTFYDGYLTGKQAKNIYSWFQSKQQEKIKRVKKLKLVKTDHCDACRALVTGYEVAIEDVLSIMEEK